MCIEISLTDKRRQRNDADNVQSSHIIIRKKLKELNNGKPQ